MTEKDISNNLINLFLLTAFIGVLDAGYLFWSHLSGGEAGCFLVEGCNLVLKSSYAEVWGMPVALGGLFYYLAVFFGFFIYNFNGNRKLLKFLALFTSVGLIATLWFLYVQAFILQAFCSYCLISAITSILLFIMGMYVLKKE